MQSLRFCSPSNLLVSGFHSGFTKFTICFAVHKKVTKADLTGNPKALRKLRTAVEGAKRALSSSTTQGPNLRVGG